MAELIHTARKWRKIIGFMCKKDDWVWSRHDVWKNIRCRICSIVFVYMEVLILKSTNKFNTIILFYLCALLRLNQLFYCRTMRRTVKQTNLKPLLSNEWIELMEWPPTKDRISMQSSTLWEFSETEHNKKLYKSTICSLW